MVGNDKDEHGCIASAGYTWSEVQQNCIRLFESGIRLEATDGKSSAYIVFSPDSLKAELFFSNGTPNEILNRRSLPAGGYAWNIEDDDTKNVKERTYHHRYVHDYGLSGRNGCPGSRRKATHLHK